MNWVKLLLPLLGSLVGCQGDGHAIDSAELVTNPCQEIRLAGFVCVDCATLGFCSNVDGQWQTVSMTSCQSERGFFCSDEGSIGCTWQPKCQVPVRGKFYCQQPGIFPDPYDCRSYHECSEQNVDTPRQCTNGAAYSLLTNSCSLPRESELCSEKQYSCSHVGQTGAWPAHNSYYYICQKDKVGAQDVFYPLMMKCSDGYSFNGHSCVPDNKIKQIEPAELCEEGAHFDAISGICRKESKTCIEGQYYPAETNSGFYVCANGQLVYQWCADGSYFDLSLGVCARERKTCEESKLYAAETKHGYLLCKNGELMSYECPEGSIFDGISAVCKPQQ
ncbi:hypothetical protein AWZ03_006422 [Drosophila navojoa]|uniref:Chitin-binding type-2 domain-containing protein n=1 Tax=Drosophila navojoa TaxID=7232 RepID=A0A484BE75_DRONA|nr:uncharacterized protein LOC108650173 [Drosophila navojoa]TDG47157.1 hypothetical protein AWZ03_006422 [Drosophila navojoa]